MVDKTTNWDYKNPMALIQKLLDDHAFFRQYLDRLHEAAQTLPTGASLPASQNGTDEFTYRLRRHARIENEVLFPALQRAGTADDRIKNVSTFLDHGKDEHASVAKRHAEMKTSTEEQALDTDWRKFMGRFSNGLLTHMQKEEEEIFPLAQALLGQDRLTELSQKANDIP